MKKAFLLISVVFVSVSCIRDVDFDQIETATFSTPANLALLQLELFPNDFLDANGFEKSRIHAKFLIDVSELFKESATDSIRWNTNFSNTFNRDFECFFEFVGSNVYGKPLFTSDVFQVPAESPEVLYSVLFTDEEFNQFTIDMRWIRVRVRLLSGQELNPDDMVSLSMQSVIHFNYELGP